MTRFAHISLVSFALAFAPACSKSPETVGVEAEMAVNADLGAEALVEEHDEGSIAWRIDGDGQVRAAVTATGGARIQEDVGGSLVWKMPDGEARTVPLAVDAKTGLLVAKGPELEADLTEVDYTITVSGKPWSGVMHVPVGGTAALVASADAAAEAKVEVEAVGPHGGSIQVVGDDRLELVADATSGETRVYVLDVDLRPVHVEKRTLRMGFVASRAELVAFSPAPTGLYFVGKLGAVVDPLRVTVALGVGGVTRTALWGYRPGIRLVAPTARVRIATAPRVHFLLRGGFDSDVDVYGRARADVHVRGDEKHVKGNNGRHFGQDGTFARDSGGFKSDNAVHKGNASGGSSKAKVAVADHGVSHAKVQVKSSGGGSAKSSGGSKSSGGGKSSSGKGKR